MICYYIMRMVYVFLLFLSFFSCGQDPMINQDNGSFPLENESSLDTLVLGGGCFWCIEAVFEQVKGVVAVESGYSGGNIPNPSYEAVCSGSSGHIEVVRLVFDTSRIDLIDLYKVFFTVHDPTSRDRQGNDEGQQYRSIIYYTNENQAEKARECIFELERSFIYDRKIVTEIQPLNQFYSAESYHQDYFENNANKAYCKLVIQPKIEKFNAVFESLKKD